MLTTFHQKMRLGRAALAAVLALSCAVAPSAAFAAKSSAKVKSKRATRAAIFTELDRMKIDLQLKADDLAETNAKIKDTQAEVDKVSAQLTEAQAAVERSRQQLSARAASLYRSDRIGMVEMLLGSRNIEDLIVRTHYLTLIGQRDAKLLNDYRLSQSEGLWLQESLNRRMDRLSSLQAQSDKELKSINATMVKATARALQIDADIAALMAADTADTNTGSGGGGSTGTRSNPNYDTLISSTNFRSQDMTTGAVQKFLSRQPGILDTYSAHDHNGKTKTAAQMIVAAGHAWNISPRVILITLQKEQSLLTVKNPSAKVLRKAMGVGYYDSGTVNQSKYAGFGNQIWYAAKTFDANAKRFEGKPLTIDGHRRNPSNSATWSLYKYTPHIAGADSFWRLWWSYFDANPTGGVPAL